MSNVLDRFSPATREWFAGAFSAPTRAQEGAWNAISEGKHTLVVAPTGSGKTLSAFLWSIDRLMDADAQSIGSGSAGNGGVREGDAPAPRRRRTRVLYISPLKALGVDVERNLRAPLVGITQTAKRLGVEPPEVTVGVRSGDTPAKDRRALISKPPDILITTPESLFLMLTSQARETLATVDTVIIDEVHAVAATKRGAHLAVSLERLDALLDAPAQRIGLSATVRPREEIARFLGGTSPVEIVAPPAEKTFDIEVVVPVDDMTDLSVGQPPATSGVGTSDSRGTDTRGSDSQGPGSQSRDSQSRDSQSRDSQGQDSQGAGLDGSAAGPVRADGERGGSIWPHVEEAIVDRILEHRSTIVFTNSRRLAERLTARLNEINEARMSDEALRDGPLPDGWPSDGMRADGRTANGQSADRWPTNEPPAGEHDIATSPTVASTSAIAPAPSSADGQTRTTPSRAPAALMGGSGQTQGVTDESALLARAHHGSVSKEQRAQIEDDLKSGQLRCVVATSSLELGIDMGEVDLVIQVEAPPSVASALQRIGRAGHQVGEISHGALFPKHRADLVNTAVTSERMLQGAIESMSVPANPLDILAQQTVAATALEALDVERWFEQLRRTAPFSALPRSAYESTLDLLAGRYPSDEFAELRPRIIWDRDAGTIEGRPGAQRLAVTSGGTIPDRGTFAVYMVGGEAGKPGARVGELDEEMVYESRVGDVFALGTTSWRIQEITFDRVLVTPEFGQPGRLPFWIGDALGRPFELGEALGRFTREIDKTGEADAAERLSSAGLDERSIRNLRAYLAEQRQATGHLPTDKTLVVERSRDELGDWRIILHSPFGMQVHAPWALAVNARVRERLGIDGASIASDDGIIVRVPETTDEPPGAELFVFDPDELEAIVTTEVGGSALFASRFRECAARALLLPNYKPGRRSPLWQQRQRSAQLLEVASKFPQFPILLETVRECLQDVYDVPALRDLAGRIASRRIRLVDTTTDEPSPYAKSLLFGYVGAFMYEGDSPLAERKAAALALDSSMLSELLGQVELRELLDPGVIAQTERELQRLTENRRMRGVEGVADLLRMLGPLDAEEVAARLDPSAAAPSRHPQDGSTQNGAVHDKTVANASTPDAVAEYTGDDVADLAESPHASVDEASKLLDDLIVGKRALRVPVAGIDRVIAIEDAARVRDSLGVPLPIGVPAAFIEPVPDPLGDLVARYARTHGPFRSGDVASRLGLGIAVVSQVLARLADQGRLVRGEFLPDGGTTGPAIETAEWCDAEVLRRLRLRSLAALRHEVEPVDTATFARFLPAWQNIGGSLRGIDGVVAAIEQLDGCHLPASAWETLILPQRVVDYSPAMLDELTALGEVVWSGRGALPGRDGWIGLHLADTAPLTLAPADDTPLGTLENEILVALSSGGAYFSAQLAQATGCSDDDALQNALWNLVWAGLVTNDTFTPLRMLVSGTGAHKTRRATPRSRLYGRRGYARPTGSAGPRLGGRWSLLPLAEQDATVRAAATVEALLDRYGVVTRGSVMAEDFPGGFALAYRVLSGFEEKGRARRGYVIDGLGASQFATSATIDRLRSHVFTDDQRPLHAVALAATDPANPYGAALPWPSMDLTGSRHRPGRKAGGIVVLVDGELACYLERGGKTWLAFTSDEATLDAAAASVSSLVRAGRIDKVAVEKVNGEFVYGSPLEHPLRRAGFTETPRGLRIRTTNL
ncbi:DEAD/DEAH box helicase [Microbacterium sp. MPKO10]|uniref:Lhr family ATP-dependent helicase n=1 Tax=Microbacterium sp. MPKO10 TaxID=2989818 RepID=UPI0022357636|nr:DEAD/DEAH box helicase [Microbacterium sp. MPKO10]MCW4458764.1 DEAD/DEAH box helicase [Microbacterium sp. MPKO10]